MINLDKTYLGIELGSTRIKAVLIDENHLPIASGDHAWENRLENGIWTYSLEDVWSGIQDCYKNLSKNVKEKFNVELTHVGALGISAMMHGYMAFDKDGTLMVPFRTWRNTEARDASQKLTDLFQFNIPERWSISHLYQCILDKEEHVDRLDYFSTLSGYIHWKLTGQKVLGVDDASGMFPIDSNTFDYDEKMLSQFDELVAPCHFKWQHVKDLMPKVLCAGEVAGTLTAEGAKLLDPSGVLQPGILMCAPEGDAGTGMVATNSCAKRTGNVSAGTSIFAMVVLEKALSKLHREIDMVTTPDGSPVAMVHANNCTSDLNAWVGLFSEFAKAAGLNLDPNTLFSILYNKALEGDPDCGGLLSYGYLSGEFITGLEEGRPLFVRKPDSKFNLANFMRTHLNTSIGAIKIGMNILEAENVAIDKLLGHGGLFKTKGVGQKIMADAMNAPVSVMETAGEGGPWGIAILAAFMINKGDLALPQYLNEKVFKGAEGSTIAPTAKDVRGFETFVERYKAGIPIEKAAVECLN